MRYYHTNIISGHPGPERTINRIAQKYVWTGWRKEILNYVQNCVSCQKVKSQLEPRYPLVPQEALRPFQRVAIDVMGPLPTTSGRTYVIVAIDYFTKWVEAEQTPENTEQKMSRFLLDRLFVKHGSPETIITDQASQFMSRVFELVCAALGITKLTTTAFHPQSNGVVERSNRTLKQTFSMMIYAERRWDECLNMITIKCQTDLSAANEYELQKDVFHLTNESEELQSKHRELSDKIKELKMTHRHTIIDTQIDYNLSVYFI